ncbi:YveK family protein [Paenibacillus oceani]|jgi:capsular polysaccharide biosynthesis protein|uniref:Lipopolysaccharide biosynthesis protein n=1 Tax=Paenibacillus oceani TaxID=2772510 RepID=A0A927H4H1_9BACL|nr:Wzz/FepE/Etk N-terminal domain-containing protein [Paenibacillus oceani]MBD2866509.1 lipopolysaccharide biosynthesis protein [Paenibacillus oceani]
MELELKEVLQIVKRKLWIIISVVLIACLATAIFNIYFAKPIYSTSTKLIVNKSSDSSNTEKLDLGSLNANIQLINTYKEILKTPAILDKVAADHPEFNLSSEGINSRITVTSKEQSQVMTIGVQDTSHTRAVGIVNAVAEVFKQEIPRIMKVDNVTILSEAKVVQNPSPISPNIKLNMVIAVIASLLISTGLIFLLEYLDDSIKSEKDIELALGVPTLAMIRKIKKKDLKGRHKASYQRVAGEKTYASSNG